MKALVFAAGLGTRLKPWTDYHPKALAPVGGEPILGRVIQKIIRCGISDIVVNVHHFAGQIAEYLNENNNFGVNISLSDERNMLLDTGGGLLNAKSMLHGDENILIHNADILTDFNLSRMAESCQTDTMATLLVKQRDTQRYLAFDHSRRMRGWTNIATGQIRPSDNSQEIARCALRAFGGVHIVTPEIFSALAEYNASLLGLDPCRDTLNGVCRFSIIDFYVNNCNRYKFTAYEPTDPYRWIDIGKIENLREANNLPVD